MHYVRIVVLAGASLSAHAAFAADNLKFGPAPSWVVPQKIPDKSTKAANAPYAVLLTDEQVHLEPGKTISFGEIAIKLQSPDGLSAGNIAFPWNPAFDTVTVNKLHIIRDGKVIDVLGAGQTFTIARRETNLDAATLDGTLTAALQPEGLQVGDIVDIAMTNEHSDPTLKNHVEGDFAAWNALPIELSHVRISWPANMKPVVRESANLPAARQFLENGRHVFELTAQAIEPLITPKSAPMRYRIGRLGELSDFQSWADLADLFRPLFESAAVVPASGSLRDELETIRKQAHSPKERAELALQLVENRIRYVALAMGTGGLVPASAETTWARRFGDCKAKTALLLALLHELGIQAEPVLASVPLGDSVGERLPMAEDFDHVLVRAHIAGKDYWLDGTRTGDTDLDSIQIPDFGWGLPLVEHAQLVKMVPAPLTVPSLERHVAIDASSGVYAPAAITIDEIYRGDEAVSLNPRYAALTPDQRDQQMTDEAKSFFDGFSVSGSSVQFDASKRELHISIKGSAKLNWKDGWFFVPTSSIGFDPDFDRPAGPLHDAPIAVAHPRYTKDEATIRLTPGLAAQQKLDSAIQETLAGVEYARNETVKGDVLTVDSSERSIASEVLYGDAVAAAPRLKALDKDDIYLRTTASYEVTDKDLAALGASTPGSAEEYVQRGNLYLNAKKYDEAIADYTAALKLDATNEWAWGNRGIAHVWKREFADAQEDLTAAEARDPTNSVALRAEGLMAEFKGECAKAVDFYTRSLASEPGRSFNIGHRATCEAVLLRYDSALADSALALKDDPGWWNLRLLRANIFMRQGNRDLVAAEADAMTKDNPNSASAWVGAAQAYAAIGQQDRAMKAFDRALAIKPEAYIYVNRSEVRRKSDVAGRAADLDAALKLAPNEPTALQGKAQLLSDSGNYKGALAMLDRVKFEPATDKLFVHYVQEQRAILMYKAGRAAEAEKLFGELSQKSFEPIELNNLCYDQATAGIRLEAALEDCRAALKVSPDDGAYLDSLGMVLLKLGKLDEALAAYNQAVAKGEGAASLMGRAFVYLKKGDRTHAEADAEAARKLSPDIDATFAEYGLKFDRAPVASAAATTH